MKKKTLQTIGLLLFCASVQGQVNSGSNGSDGAFNPTTNTIVNMANRPDGIYHYTSVNIPSGVTVTFISNANNTPVVWLVESNCTIAGTVSVNGSHSSSVNGASGGPGGWRGGNGALGAGLLPGPGLGPGGGTVGTELNFRGGNASYGTVGSRNTNNTPQFPPGALYGNTFTLPLLGGSGGSGGREVGGGGGGGAIVIAASGTIHLTGSITALGGNGYYSYYVSGMGTYHEGSGGAGSGGAIRLVGTTVSGNGSLNAGGGSALYEIFNNYPYGAGYRFNSAGTGRIRIDGFNIVYNGPTTGTRTSGFQPIILPTSEQNVELQVMSVAGGAVSSTPLGLIPSPDVVVAAQQSNPIPIVVRCTNLPLNSPVTVTVIPANGSAVSAVGYNNSGTQNSSTATVMLNMPRGGGVIYATTSTGN